MMGKKKKYRSIKRMIQRAFEEACRKRGVDASCGAYKYEDGIWHCGWSTELEVPDWFDSSIRETAEEEIRPYLETVYLDVLNVARECFGDITHGRNPNGWFNFTYHLPPVHIAVPEKWEHVNGVFQKVQDARLLTDEEIEENLSFYKEKAKTNEWAALDAKMLEWERENWNKYFRFVGGSPFTDELFETTHYAGIRIGGHFSFKAYDVYLPGYVDYAYGHGI